MNTAFIKWFKANRSNSRLGFLLQIGSRIAGSALGLIWTRLLLFTMGGELFGLFLSFQAVATLGGLGDLGMGGALGLRASQQIGAGERADLRQFLSVARLAFLALAGFLLLAFIALSPWLPGWLGFHAVKGSGDLRTLFAIAGLAVFIVILNSYVTNLNYATLTITWPTIPLFMIAQLAFALHWIGARAGQPLWVQYLAYVLTSALVLALGWCFLRWASPDLSHLLPLKWEWERVGGLASRSAWAYLASLGYTIYVTSDRLLINAGFGPSYVTPYQLNFRLCELSVFVVTSIGFVSMPKLAQWLASPEPHAQDRARVEAQRMSSLQSFLGIALAVFYLGMNDWVVRLWVGDRMWEPLALQIAFAANLAVGAGCDAGTQLSSRLGERGMRFMGLSTGLTGLLNALLSFAAMKFHWILGIAIATVVAQSAQSLAAGTFATKGLGLNRRIWITRSWLIPVAGVAAAATLRWIFNPTSPGPALVLVVGDAIIVVGAAWALGLRPAQFVAEWRILRTMFGR